MKKIIKALLMLLVLIFVVMSSYLGYWVYSNQTNKLSSIGSEPYNSNVITKENVEAGDGVEYGTGSNLQSPEQIAKYRSDKSQKIFLRGYLSIPNIGINLQIMEGTSNRVLSYGAGTINQGEKPDKIGNYALAAHNYADWYYGNGFSRLQLYQNRLAGMNAYVTDGEYVYTYKLVNTITVPREDSMNYVESDFSNRELSKYNEELANDKKEVKYNDENYTYGRLLTLYTCFEEPPDYYMSYNRIIVRGVQTEQVKLEDSSDYIKSLFIINKSTTEISESKLPSNSISENNIGLKYTNDNKEELSLNPIDSVLNKYLEKDRQFVKKALISSLILLVVIFIILILI